MNILILSDAYLPDSTLVHAKMLHELALELKKQHHNPIIITPLGPNFSKTYNIRYLDGIEIWEFFSLPSRNVSRTLRALSETLMPFLAYFFLRTKIKKTKIDLIINYSPTIFFGVLAKFIKSDASKVYLVLRDQFPQWAVDQGIIKKNSFIEKYFRYFENINYSVSDRIGVMSDSTLEEFKLNYPHLINVEVLYNWSNLMPFDLSNTSTNFREKYGLTDKVIFFYGGNIGIAQDMTNIMRLARSFQDNLNSHFLIIGSGEEYSTIKNLKLEWSLENVSIYESIDQKSYIELLSQVDIGLISLSKDNTSHNFPGKLLGYMNQSLPILGSINPGNDLLSIINNNNAGKIVLNGNDEDFYKAAYFLASSKKDRLIMGKNGRTLLKKYFDVRQTASQITASLNS